MLWAECRPDVITGEGSNDAKLERFKQAAKVAREYWTRQAGVMMPIKKRPMLLEVLILVLQSLDLRVPSDLRACLLFNIAFVCGARGKEMVNLTWKDVTILGRGEAVLLDIQPSKCSSLHKSTHTCQIGRREHPQVMMRGFLNSGIFRLQTYVCMSSYG